MRDGWTETTLGDISTFVSGRELPEDLAPDTPYVGLEHVEPKTTSISTWGNIECLSSSVTPFEPEDTLFGRLRPYLHKVAFADFPGVCSPEILVLRSNTRCEPKFLYLLCSRESTVKKCVDMSAGTRMPRTSTSDLASIEIQLPPFSEQKRIVDVVSSVDAYIDALQKQADTARTARNAVLHELLSAGGDDWTEKTLNVKRVEDFAFLKRGHDLPTQSRVDGDYPVVASNGSVGYHDECIGPIPGVVTGRSGTIGKVMYLENGYWPLNTTLYVTDFMGNNEKFVALTFEIMRLETFAGGTTVPSLDRKVIRSELVYAPSVEEQKRIVAIILSMDEVIQSTEQAVADAKNLRSGLLSDLLSGEHEIPASYDVFVGAA